MTEKKTTLEYEPRVARRRKRSPRIYVVATVCSAFVFLFSIALAGAITDHVSVPDMAAILIVEAAIALAVYTFLAFVKSYTDDSTL